MIQKIHAEMRLAMLTSGITAERYDVVLDKEKHDQVLVLIEIQNIYIDAYANYLKVRNLRSEDQWNFYALMGLTGLREQYMLDQAMIHIRKSWRNLLEITKLERIQEQPEEPRPETRKRTRKRKSDVTQSDSSDTDVGGSSCSTG